MKNSEFAKILEKRTKQLTLEIIKMSSLLPNTPEGRVIRYQICKSGSSIGANYREANRARSLADFRSKIGICESEASETAYWIEVINESQMCKGIGLDELYKETCEILRIFTSIGKTCKK